MKSFERKVFPYLMLAPTLLVFGVFLFYPALNGVWISLTKWDGVNPQKFIGFQNYLKLAADKNFWESFDRGNKRKQLFSGGLLMANHDFQYCSRFDMALFIGGRFRRGELSSDIDGKVSG